MKDFVFELGGEHRQLRFNVGALKTIRDLTKKDVFENRDEADQYDQLAIIVFAGLKADHVFRKEQMLQTLENVVSWVDELSMQEGIDILAAFNSATAIKQEGTAEGEAEDKKK
jgi:hypothetical protein